MKPLRSVLAFYINSSIHVALSVVAFTCITLLEYGLEMHWQLLVFVFLGAVTGYNFVKYARIARLHHRNLTQSLKSIQVFSGFCFLLWVYFAFQLSFDVLLWVAGFGLATFFYAVPLLQHRNLRNMAGLKIFVVALVWAGMTVIVPVVGSGQAISTDNLLSFLQRMLLVIVLMFPFEIRDIPYDSLALKTLPQQIGVWNTKLFGEVVLILSVLLECLKGSVLTVHCLSLVCFVLIVGGVLLISKTQQKIWFASFWVESLPILWLFIYLFFEGV